MTRRHPPLDLTVHDWGGPQDAMPLLLMHGLTDSGACWADAVRRWGAQYRVLSWDARGHGTSPRFTDEQLRAGVGETMLTDAVDVLEGLAAQGLERPVLVGHSMGGGTAGSVAATRPDLVRAAVLEDPALGQDPGEDEQDRLRAGSQRVADALLWLEDPDTALARGLTDHPGWPEVEYAAWARAKRQTDVAMLATGQARVRRTWRDVARDIAVPALLLTCDDPLLWDDDSREQLRSLGNPLLQVEQVKGAGHCIRRTRTQAYHGLVDPWLARHA
jgi:pimeloyl-ACP methyl ester carboxylesterase